MLHKSYSVFHKGMEIVMCSVTVMLFCSEQGFASSSLSSRQTHTFTFPWQPGVCLAARTKKVQTCNTCMNESMWWQTENGGGSLGVFYGVFAFLELRDVKLWFAAIQTFVPNLIVVNSGYRGTGGNKKAKHYTWKCVKQVWWCRS